jgi:hypothetical protein
VNVSVEQSVYAPQPHRAYALRTIIGALDPAERVYLYGSRADDTRKGGDIDGYLQASRPIDLKTRINTRF